MHNLSLRNLRRESYADFDLRYAEPAQCDGFEERKVQFCTFFTL